MMHEERDMIMVEEVAEAASAMEERENICTAKEADAVGEEVERLRRELQEARAALQRREAEMVCTKVLREHGLSEAFGEWLRWGDADETEMQARAARLSAAIWEAAKEEVHRRAVGRRPETGESGGGISAEMLREMPIAELARIRG